MNQYRVKLKDKYLRRVIDQDTGEYIYELLSSVEDSTVFWTRLMAAKEIDAYIEWYEKTYALSPDMQVLKSMFEVISERCTYHVTPMSEIRYRGTGMPVKGRDKK